MPTEPPTHGETGNDEEWDAWPEEATGDQQPESARDAPPLRPRGSLLGSAMRGLHDALYGPREDPVVIEVGAGDPGGPEGMTVHLDEDAPEKSWVRINRQRRPRDPGAP